LNELRDSEEFEACEAVLEMDNCSPHMPDDVVAVLMRVRVRIITFASHTTHIFRLLDVILFGALKKHATGLETLDGVNQLPRSCSRSITTSNKP
jgi:hypothetical protein